MHHGNFMIAESISIEGNKGTIRRLISGAEPFVLGHYPHLAIFPGVLSLQLCIDIAEELAASVSCRPGCRVRRVNRVQFLGIVMPGDELVVDSSIEKKDASGYTIRCVGRVGSNAKVKATLCVLLPEHSS